MKASEESKNHLFLHGGGEMGELTRNFEWSGTKLGPPDNWPHSLRVTVSNLLRTRFPMLLWWGQDMIQFYNDAYCPSLEVSGKHPGALGQKGQECWSETWDTLSPMLDQVKFTGEPTRDNVRLVPIYRNGKLDQVYWTFSYSSVLNDEGEHGGVLVTCMETTEEVALKDKSADSDARLRFLIEQAPFALALTRGEDLTFVSINPLMLQVIDKQSKNEVLGKKLSAVLPELTSQPLFEQILSVLHTGESFSGTEVEVELSHAGVLEVRHFNITYSRIIDKDGVGSVLHMCIDVSQQVRARRKSEESEAKLRSILNSAPTAMGVFVGPDLIMENPNQLMIEVMAAGPDIEGKSFRKLLAGLVEGDQMFIQIIDAVRADGEAFQAQEVEVFFKNENKTRYFNINFIPLLDENARVYAVLDVSVDVSNQVASRKKMLEIQAQTGAKVAASEQKFRSLIAEAPFATALYLGPELTIDTINDAMLRLWDKPPSVVGQTFDQAMPELIDQPFPALLKTVYRSGVEYIATGEKADIMINGQMTRGWYNFNYKPVRDENGNVYGIVHMAVDVTEQVLAQQKLEESRSELATALEQARLAKEAAELGTFDLDLKKQTMHWDDRCRTMFGISYPAPGNFVKDFINRIHPDDKARITGNISKALKKKESNGDFDVVFRTIGTENEVERWVKAKGKVYFAESNTPMRFIGSVLDISEQMTAMQKIEQTVDQRTRELAMANASLNGINRELHRSNQNLEEFAHAASHDLKEPVRKIHFFTRQLKEQLREHLNEPQTATVQRIENATERMAYLIDDLLLYSHVTQQPHQTERIDLNGNIEKVLEDLELAIEEKHAVIQVAKLPVVEGYHRQLQQLFQNLISNALKYSKPSVPPVISITACETMENGKSYHSISVQDNGIGFEQEYADKIFHMFTRLHGRSEYSGTGVGLSIVKKVVGNHNGFIHAESTPNEGAIFTILLPMKN